MTSPSACRTAAVLLVWLVPGGQVPAFAETGGDRIYWTDMDGIYWSDLEEGTTRRIIAADTRRPGKIAVDAAGGKIYWVDKRGESIQWSDLDGSNSAPLIGPQTHGSATDLALDLDRGKIYFSVVSTGSDAIDGGVYRANLDGSETEFLERGHPSALVLDPARDLVYLIDWYGIYLLDGESGYEYVLDSYPLRDLALDLVNDKVYWTNPEERAIRRSDLDGSNVEDVLTELADTPGEIALDPERGKVYWTLLYDAGYRHESHGGLLRANLDGSDMEHVVERGEVVGFTLDLDGSKVYWTDARGTIQRAGLDGSSVEDLFAPLTRAPHSVALHAREGRIYWTDLMSGTVQRAEADGSEHEVLVEGLDTPRGVCLGGDRIYWADWGAGKIQSARLDGSDRDDTAVELNHPVMLALDPVHGRIYWTEPIGRRIGWAALDGSDIGGFSVAALPQGIALDASRGEVYWTWDDWNGSTGIRRSSLEGTDTEDLVAGKAFEVYKAIALGPVGGKIHWTTVFTPPPLGPHEGADAWVGVRRADLDGSNEEEAAWLYRTGDLWLLTGFRILPLEFAGSALALHMSRQTAVSAETSVPLSTTLHSSYPNPFNGSTLISYTLAASGPVSLVVYNTLGQPVQTLVDQVQAPGAYSVPWQAAEALASGVYLYRLTTADAVLTRRLALVR